MKRSRATVRRAAIAWTTSLAIVGAMTATPAATHGQRPNEEVTASPDPEEAGSAEVSDPGAAPDLDDGSERDRLSWFAMPLAGFTPETSVAFAALGVFTWRLPNDSDAAPPSNLTSAVIYTLRNQWMVLLEPSLYLDDAAYWVTPELKFRYWPDSFFGVGDDTDAADRESYTLRELEADLEVRRAIVDRSLYAGVVYTVTLVDVLDVEPGGLLDGGDVVGANGGVSSGAGMALTWDTRDNKLYTRSGSLVRAAAIGYGGFLGSDHDRLRFDLDARTFLSTATEHTLALQLESRVNVGETPLWALAQLGGAPQLCGILESRYQDRGRLYAQAAYRTPIRWRLGGVAFAGVGDVFPNIASFDLDDIKWAVGGGMRIAIDEDEGVNFRLDIGYSPHSEEIAFYASFAEAF